MKVNLSPVGKMYVVCALLENAQTCFYGNQVSEMFGIDPPLLNDYFAWQFVISERLTNPWPSFLKSL